MRFVRWAVDGHLGNGYWSAFWRGGDDGRGSAPGRRALLFIDSTLHQGSFGCGRHGFETALGDLAIMDPWYQAAPRGACNTKRPRWCCGPPWCGRYCDAKGRPLVLPPDTSDERSMIARSMNSPALSSKPCPPARRISVADKGADSKALRTKLAGRTRNFFGPSSHRAQNPSVQYHSSWTRSRLQAAGNIIERHAARLPSRQKLAPYRHPHCASANHQEIRLSIASSRKQSNLASRRHLVNLNESGP